MWCRSVENVPFHPSVCFKMSFNCVRLRRCVHCSRLISFGPLLPILGKPSPIFGRRPFARIRRKGSVRHLTMGWMPHCTPCTTDVDIAYSQTGRRQCRLNRRNGSLFHRPIFEFKPVLFYPMFTFHPHLTTPWFAQTGREPFIPIYGDKFATLVRFLSFAAFVKEKVAWRGTPVIFYCTIDLPIILYGGQTWLSVKWTDLSVL